MFYYDDSIYILILFCDLCFYRPNYWGLFFRAKAMSKVKINRNGSIDWSLHRVEGADPAEGSSTYLELDVNLDEKVRRFILMVVDQFLSLNYDGLIYEHR